MPLPTKDKRRSPRRPAEGPVTLREDLASPVRGALMDVSEEGFRATHPLRSLCSGDIVEFAFEKSAGRARVMWTRITDSSVESGFLILCN